MKGSPWKFINEKIKNCRCLQNTEKVIKCFKELFQTTNDGNQKVSALSSWPKRVFLLYHI